MLAGVPRRAAANCRREKGAGAVGAGAAMIRRCEGWSRVGWLRAGVNLEWVRPIGGKRGRRD